MSTYKNKQVLSQTFFVGRRSHSQKSGNNPTNGSTQPDLPNKDAPLIGIHFVTKQSIHLVDVHRHLSFTARPTLHPVTNNPEPSKPLRKRHRQGLVVGYYRVLGYVPHRIWAARQTPGAAPATVYQPGPDAQTVVAAAGMALVDAP